MVILRNTEHKRLLDRINELENAKIGLELKNADQAKTIKDYEKKLTARELTVNIAKLQEEWLNGAPNAKH